VGVVGALDEVAGGGGDAAAVVGSGVVAGGLGVAEGGGGVAPGAGGAAGVLVETKQGGISAAGRAASARWWVSGMGRWRR